MRRRVLAGAQIIALSGALAFLIVGWTVPGFQWEWVVLFWLFDLFLIGTLLGEWGAKP